MANSDKNIRIQPNRNSTLFPKITFTGQSNNPITLNVLDDNSLSFEGSSGQLFAINNNLSSGYIFSVNDISGLPSFRINADGTVGIAEYYGNVGIGVTNPLYKFHARGDSYFSSTGNTALLLISGTGGTIIASNSVNVTLTDPARKALVLNAATSQTANILEWYADGGQGLGYSLAGTVRPAGQLHLGSPGLTMSNGGSAILGLQGRGSSEGLAIRGYNSNATNPLFEVQGNAGNQLFGIYGDGGVNAPRINVTNTTGSTSTSTGALIVSGGVGIGGSLNVNNIGIGFTGIPYNPAISFIGTTGDPIRLSVLANNTLSFEGSSGQLFSINNNLSSGWIFSVNDISGIPLFRANANANIAMAEYAGNVGIGLSNATFKLQVAGSASIGNTLITDRLKVNSKITFEPGTGTSAVSGWTGIGLTSISKMIYAANRFVGVGGSYVAYSNDGVNFTYTTIPGQTSSAAYGDIAYGNGIFVAVNVQDVAFTAYSYDGASWGTTSIPRGLIRTVGFGNGRFLAFGEANAAVYSSTDGRNWSTIGSLGEYGREVTFANGYFLSARGVSLYYSKDGASWKRANTPGSNNIFASTYGKGLYIAADYNTAQYFTSPDLVNWTQRPIDNKVWTGASYVNGVFYLVPNNNNFLHHSLDGINWSTTNFGTPIGGVNKFFTANDRLYFYSQWNTTLWSTDATTGTLMAKPFYNGEIENTRIGAVNPDSATFTHLTAFNDVSFTSATASTSFDSGALTVTGGVGIGGTLNVGSAQVIRNFTHTPSQTTIGGASGWVANTTPAGLNPGTIKYLNNKFIGIGGTYIYYSDDAITWSSVMVPNLDTTRAIADITYGEGKYVFVQYYTSNAGYSTNLTNWTNVATTYNSWLSVEYGNNRFIATAGGGPYAYSLDGTSWTSINDARFGYNNAGIQFINGYFYVTNANSIVRTTDGITWQTCNTPALSFGLAYGNGLYVGGVYNSGTIIYSYDGLNFSSYTGSSYVHNNAWFYNGVYYLTTNNNYLIRYSTDGFNWSNSSGFPHAVRNLRYAQGRLWAESNGVLYSTEATPGKFEVNPLRTGNIDDVEIGRLSPNNANFIDVSVNNNLNVSSQYDSASVLDGALTVSGGVGIGKTLNVGGSVNVSNSFNLVNTTTGIATTWTRTVVGTAATISYLAYANNLYVGVGYSSLTSTDGINWTTRTLPNNLSSVAYGNGIWSGLLYNSALGATSTNGTTWTSFAMTNSRNWSVIAYGNGKFVALATGTNIAAYSTNGYNWTEVTLPTGNLSWTWVTYGGGYFVAVANSSSTAVYSNDGINWNTTTLSSASGWNCITYGNGYYFATGSGNNGTYSKDLINWTNYPLNVNAGNSLLVSYNNGAFVVVDSPTAKSNIITGDFTTNTSVTIPFSHPMGQLAAGDRIFISGWGQSFLSFPIPNNSVSIFPNTTGELNNVEIGSVKPASGAFSNIFAQNTAVIGSTIRSTSPYTGALTVAGGVGIGGSLYSGSIFTPGRLQNQSFSGSAVGASDGRMGAFDGAFQYQSTGNGVIVATSWGAYNARYSTDGLNWLSTTLPVNQGYPINFFGNGYFVLSASGSTTILYSTNGSSWSQVSIGNTLPRSSGTYGNGKYLIVGSGSTYNYSTNLTTWSTGTLPLQGDWRIAYGNGMFVAIAYGTNRLIYSYDGVNWNIGNTNSVDRNFMKITYTNGKFMVTAYSGGGTYYSYDGINWFGTSSPGSDVINLSYGNGVYFANDFLKYTYSSDGFNWSSFINFSAGYESFQSVYAFNKFNTVGRLLDGPTNTVTLDPKFTGEINNVRIGALTPASGDFTNLSSTGSANLVGTVNANNLNVISKINQTPVLGGFAGTTGWTYQNVLTNPVHALTFGNGLFVSIRRNTDNVNISSDGNRWTLSTMPFSGSWLDIAWGKDKFVAVAGVGTSGAYSGNGISWTSMNMPATAQGWYAITYGDDKFVAVGSTSIAAYSSDGITWSGSSIANTNWTGIAYGNGTFVAVAGVGQSGAYSYDGINWNLVNLPTATGGNTTKFITYGNGYFIVTNYVSTSINYSRDGINWSTSTRSSGYGIHTDIAYGNGIYSILNYDEASFSYDGINWLNSNNIISTDWQAVAYGNNRFVATSINTGNVAAIDGPSNTLNLYPKFTGDIDNVRIGAKQPGAAEFTNLAAQQPVRFTANTPSTNATSGALVVLGGVGIGGSINAQGNINSGLISSPQIYQISGSGSTGALTPSTLYYYAVTAIDFDGNESAPSAQASVNTSTNTSVQLRWYTVPGARQYKVYRSTTSGVFSDSFIRTTKNDNNTWFLDYGFGTTNGTPPTRTLGYTNKISYNTSNFSSTGNILHGVNIPSGSLSVNTKNDSPLTTVEINGDAAFTRLPPSTGVTASSGGTLTTGTVYYYRHSFVDMRGNESLASDPATFQATSGGAVSLSWSIENAQYQVGRIYRSTNIDNWTNTFIAETTANNFLDINYPQLNASPVTTSSSHSYSYISGSNGVYSSLTHLALSAGRTNFYRINGVPTITASTSTAAGTLSTNTTYYYKAVFYDILGGTSRFGPEVAINSGVGTAINLSVGISQNQGVYIFRSTTPNFTTGSRMFTTGSITDDGSISNSTAINSSPLSGYTWSLGYAGNMLPFNITVAPPSNGYGLGIAANTPAFSYIGNSSSSGTLITGTKYYYRIVGYDAFGQPTSSSQMTSLTAPATGAIYMAFGSSKMGFTQFDLYRSTDPNNWSNTYLMSLRNNYFTDLGYTTSSGSPRESSNGAKDIYLRGVNDYNIHTPYGVISNGFYTRTAMPYINTAFGVGPSSGTLTSNTDYYYKIRVHFWANNTYGEVSDPIKVNTGTNNAVYLQWPVVEGAQQYSLYRSTDPKNFNSAILINGIKDNFAYDYGHSVATETPAANYNGSNNVIGDGYGNRLSSLLLMGDTQKLRSLFDAPKFSLYPSATTGGTLANNTVFFYTIVARGYLNARSLSSTEIRVDTGGNNAISLNWLNVNGATGYDIYRSTTINSWTNTLIASNVQSTSFIDINYPTTSGTPDRLNAYGVGSAQSLFENNYNILGRTIFGSVNNIDSSYQNFTVRVNGNIFRNSQASTLQVGTGFTIGYTFNGSSSGTELGIASGAGFTGSLIDAHSDGVSRFRVNVDGSTSIASTTGSTSSSTGAFIVSGGVGIGQTLNVGNDVVINGGKESSSTSTGSLIVRGGVGITGGLYVKPYSLSTKGLVVQANSSQTGNLFELQSSALSTITSFNANGELNITSTTGSTSATTGSIVTGGGVGIGGSVTIGSTAASVSTTSGALKVTGGVGIGGTLNVGGSVNFSSSIFGGVSTSITPTMTFIGQANDPITLSVLADNSLSFDGSSGQLFSINNNLSTGWIFSISDISGLPLFRTNADGTVSMGEFGGNVGIGLTNPSYKLQVTGNAGIANTLFVSGNAHFGSTSYYDTYDIYNSPIITATENFAGDTGIQIQNKSNDLNARSGINIYNDFSTDYFNIMLGSSNYAGIGQSVAFIETNKLLDISFATNLTIRDGVGNALVLSGIAVTVAPTTESTSSTTGSLIVTGGAGIGKSLNVAGYLSSKPAYATAGLTSDQTLNTAADTILTMIDKDDPNGWWIGTAAVGSSHRFKPNIAGSYYISFQVHFRQATGTGQINIQARKNGNTFSFSRSEVTTQSSGLTLNGTGIVQLNGSTDYVDFTGYSSVAQSLGSDANSAWTCMTAHKIF